MSFELRLSFSGLTALVPRKIAGSQANPSEWLVVMPSLATGETVKIGGAQGDRQFVIAPHQALLVVDALNFRDSTTKTARLRVEDLKSGRSDLFFSFEHETLSIESGALGLAVQKTTAAAEAKESPTTLEEKHDMRWVPPIPHPFKKGLVDPDTLRPADPIIGVVRLDRGSLETVDVHRTLDNQPVLFEFRKGSAAGEPLFKQALANTFRLRVEVEQEEATLVLTDRNGDQKLLVVGEAKGNAEVPKNEKGNAIVEVKVFNRELESILGFGAPPDLTPAGLEPGDTDFAIFYKLSSAWATMTADDVALPYSMTPGGGADRKPCEPPTYPGFEA